MSVIVRPPTLLWCLIYVPIKRMLTRLVRGDCIFFYLYYVDNAKAPVKFMLLIIQELMEIDGSILKVSTIHVLIL